MKLRRPILPVSLLAILIILVSSLSSAQTFTLQKTVAIDYGSVWSVPVYDGSDIVVSTESSGSIKVGKYDLSLNQTGTATTVATSSDTANNDSIADHKHIFQNGYHYLAFSTAGSGQGGYLYLLKLNPDLTRAGITTVVSNDPPTNDMLLAGEGTYIYAGKFLPGTGHRMYKYDADLAYQNSYDIGGGSNGHANGAAAVYTDNQFHLIAPLTLAPGQNDAFYRIVFDNNWNVVQNSKSVLYDQGMLGIVSALSVEQQTQDFIVHYGRGSSDAGGPLYRAVYDSNWNMISNAEVVNGTWTRPHSVIVNNTLYVGYDGSGSSVQLSSFTIAVSPTATPAATPTPDETPSATPTPTTTPLCEIESIEISPARLTLHKKKSGDVTVVTTGLDNCQTEGGTITAQITSGKKYISISPATEYADAEGKAEFTITAKNKSGKAKVTFQAGELTETIEVKVK
jgi:hypothetical protein